ncbi:MAG: hypothetical protein K0S18_691 [Anaerocolumna sp.]|jgi:hypothetical protein|nr:hypothetical protein [Anaerocolumna sp.]
MRERYITPVIMLSAAAITSIFNVINRVELIDGLKKLLLIIIIFYFIGRIATKVIVKTTNMEPKINDSKIEASETEETEA